jgi:hypothetical protein
MTIVNMNVQGADGVSRDVPLDSIVGQDYDVPVYKLTIGDEGDDDGMVSAANPLPVTIAETPLPDDAATETTLAEINAKVTDDPATATNQETLIGHVDGIETLLAGGLPIALGTGGGLKIDGSGTAIAVSVESSALPDGAATETTLSALNAKIITSSADTARTIETVVLPVQFVDSSGRSPKTDSTTKALMIIDYAHHEIHSGSTFRVQAFDDAIAATAASGELVIAFFVPNQEKKPHMIWDFVHEGDMTLSLLEGVTLTAGTGTNVTCKNSNRSSSNTSVLQGVATGALLSGNVTANPTYSGGTAISLIRNYGAKNVGSESGRRDEIILNPNTYYAFVLDNNETTTQGGQIRLEWYEHTDS